MTATELRENQAQWDLEHKGDSPLMGFLTPIIDKVWWHLVNGPGLVFTDEHQMMVCAAWMWEAEDIIAEDIIAHK